MAKVTFDNVSKRFDSTTALRNFSLNINDGEFVVLVGPSGCGKSTALRLLAGLEMVSEGEIYIDDRPVNQLTPQQRNVAMVFQNYALYPHMSVQANLEFPLRMSHSPVAERQTKVAQIADLLNLTGLLQRKPRQLSGGQRQRVAMGRALVRDPSVFLLDEPLSNLDAKLRAQIRADIARLQKRLQKSTLYVTHDQVEAMTLGDRVAVMNAGELQQLGTPVALYQQPRNIFVARFLGNPGMNIFSSTLRQSEEGLQFELAGQWLTVPRHGRSSDDTLQQYVGQSLYVGLRPEALSLDHDAHPYVELALLAVESLGHEQLLYFKYAAMLESNLIVRKPDIASYSLNQTMPVHINTRELYFFNADGEAILP
jgi:multiple sugar transport system ATP-binding protein